VDTTGIPLEQFTTHHTHQVDHEDHSTLFVLQDDSGGQDQEVWMGCEPLNLRSSLSTRKPWKGFLPGKKCQCLSNKPKNASIDHCKIAGMASRV